MIATVATRASGWSSDDGRVEQHADGDEEQHGEGITQRQRLLRGPVAQVGLAQDDPREEGPECERHVEQLRGQERDAERDGQHAEGEQLL